MDSDTLVSPFNKMVDDLVVFSEHDKELADGIKWLDSIAINQGVSFYDVVYKILYQHHIKERAKEWRKNKDE